MQREEFMRGLQVLISNVSDQSTRNLLAKELETALKSLRQENPNIKANRQRFSRDLSQGILQLSSLESSGTTPSRGFSMLNSRLNAPPLPG